METVIDISFEIERLLNYGQRKNLIAPINVPLIRNVLLDMLNVSRVYEGSAPEGESPSLSEILNNILQYCFECGLLPDNSITGRDLLSARIMGAITPNPSEVIRRYESLYRNSPMDATDYLYNLCCDVNYIHLARAKKNFNWSNSEDYGNLEFTINFQSPEKTEAEINARNSSEKTGYPKCELCIENVGFSGNLWSRAGQNLRLIPLTLLERRFYFGFPPEQHYNERCYLASEKHEPLGKTEDAFGILLDFVERYPHYFMGLDEQLPGCSDSLAAHEHYQGGCFVLPIEYADTKGKYINPEFDDVEAGILKWPVSTIRLECDNAQSLSRAAAAICDFWSGYSDGEAGIHAVSQEGGSGKRHNSVGAVARKNVRGCFEIDIMLRNNAEAFSRRPEVLLADASAGLTEACGLAVFPERFDGQLLRIMSFLMTGRKYEQKSTSDINRFWDWTNDLVAKYGVIDSYQEAKSVICYEVARKFAQALENSGVFKLTDAGGERFRTFMLAAGFFEM